MIEQQQRRPMSRSDKNRLEETLLEAVNRYVLSFVGKSRPSDYEEVVQGYYADLRRLHDMPTTD